MKCLCGEMVKERLLVNGCTSEQVSPAHMGSCNSDLSAMLSLAE